MAATSLFRVVRMSWTAASTFGFGDHSIEEGDRVAVETTVLAPEWSGPVTLFKVFTFAPHQDVVVRRVERA
jgi:hypothetical protein